MAGRICGQSGTFTLASAVVRAFLKSGVLENLPLFVAGVKSFM
jgi:hypothetical protein